MFELQPTPITANVYSFFKPKAAPGSLRFLALLAGDISGSVWVDHADHPAWGILQEAAYGTLYLEGQFPEGFLTDFIHERRKHGEVLYGFWSEDDPYRSQFPTPQYQGEVFESEQRSRQLDLTRYIQWMPPDCIIRSIDAELFPRTQDCQFYSEMFGSPARALEKMIGGCLMRDHEIVCEAFAGTAHRDLIEIGVNTAEKYRQQGYATITCAHVTHEAEQRGYRTYWNCAAQNTASKALAEKLGYTPMQPYHLLGWF